MNKYLYFILSLCIVVVLSCKNVAKYPMDDPSPEFVFDGIIGKWKVEEDSNKSNFIEVTKGRKLSRYHVICWQNEGTNPAYESYMHFSKLNNDIFLNVACWDEDRDDSYYQSHGYMFFKVITLDMSYRKMSVATIADTTMYKLGSKLEVFNRVAKNLNNKAFYADTLHLYKTPVP